MKDKMLAVIFDVLAGHLAAEIQQINTELRRLEESAGLKLPRQKERVYIGPDKKGLFDFDYGEAVAKDENWEEQNTDSYAILTGLEAVVFNLETYSKLFHGDRDE